MGRPLDYDEYAGPYAHTRWAVPWVLEPLSRETGRLPARSTVTEIGCGTGNYVIALSRALPHLQYRGFDLSEEMLKVARSRSVIHHILALDIFFTEPARILRRHGRLVIVTDSEENIRTRSLTRYFPDILAIELERYPRLEVLHGHAARSALNLMGAEPAEGTIDFDEAFVAALEAKCSSAMRLIPAEAHRSGIERVLQARDRGESWHSCYTVVKYGKSCGGPERSDDSKACGAA